LSRRAAPRPRTILVVVALALTGILAAVLIYVFWREPQESREPRVYIGIGSKPFTESVILGDMVQHLVERAGDTTEHRQPGGTRIVAEHRRQLGGTRVVWEAMVGGKVDVYAEYTGTLAREIFGNPDLQDESKLRAALEKYGIRMTRPIGFNNSYVIGMRKDIARQRGITKISDLARQSNADLLFGFTNEFMNRTDGWPALREKYGLLQQARGLEHSLTYPALQKGSLHATDAYATDAEIAKYDLQLLDDDLHVFPPYDAVLLYRADLEQRAPEAVAALQKLGGLSADEMRAMNARNLLEKVPESQIAAEFINRKLGTQAVSHAQGPWQELLKNSLQHLVLVTASLLAAIVAAVPLGICAARGPTLGQAILGAAGIIQTIPSLALLVFMVVLLQGMLGAVPAIMALFLYSLLPIIRNTHTGLTDVPLPVRESAEALGLPPLARLWLIELPMASRTILAGIKTSAVINVGYATLGGLIGAGGYGQPILEGLRRYDPQTILLQGVLPAAAMALALQGLFELAERRLVPRGLRLRSGG
jgi:osmoprotectant transport system permease protein